MLLSLLPAGWLATCTALQNKSNRITYISSSYHSPHHNSQASSSAPSENQASLSPSPTETPTKVLQVGDYAPPKDEVTERGACPALNVLANHGFLNRDGKNITVADLETAVEVYFGLNKEFARVLLCGIAAPGNSPADGGGIDFDGDILDCLFPSTDSSITGTFDLSALFNHTSGADHDASLFRVNNYFEDPPLFSQARWDQFVEEHTNSDSTHASIKQVVDFQLALLEESCASTPDFLINGWGGKTLTQAAGEKVAVFVLQSNSTMDILGLHPDKLMVNVPELYSLVKPSELPDNFQSRTPIVGALDPYETLLGLKPVNSSLTFQQAAFSAANSLVAVPTIFNYVGCRMCEVQLNDCLSGVTELPGCATFPIDVSAFPGTPTDGSYPLSCADVFASYEEDTVAPITNTPTGMPSRSPIAGKSQKSSKNAKTTSPTAAKSTKATKANVVEHPTFSM